MCIIQSFLHNNDIKDIIIMDTFHEYTLDCSIIITRYVVIITTFHVNQLLNPFLLYYLSPTSQHYIKKSTNFGFFSKLYLIYVDTNFEAHWYRLAVKQLTYTSMCTPHSEHTISSRYEYNSLFSMFNQYTTTNYCVHPTSIWDIDPSSY